MSQKIRPTTRLRSYMSRAVASAAIIAVVAFAMARAGTTESKAPVATVATDTTALYTARDTTIDVDVDATGIASPIQQATLSTRLMGTVTAVQVREGDRVAAGQLLMRIDARDLAAKSTQAAASIAEAEALHRDALAQANRIRSLYADSAATAAQLDAATAELARTSAALEAAQAAASELSAISSYSVIRAPFAGVVAKRYADAGAFATPGAPLITIQDVSVLRISATTTPGLARGLRRAQMLAAQVEQTPVRAAVEGVVPSAAGSLYAVNAVVVNPDGVLLAGSRASLTLPMGRRRVLIVPAPAIVRVGDLAGVTVRGAHGDDRRWVRLGRSIGNMVEVTAGLVDGDRIVMPAAPVAARQAP